MTEIASGSCVVYDVRNDILNFIQDRKLHLLYDTELASRLIEEHLRLLVNEHFGLLAHSIAQSGGLN